ncbi:hypothetical protein LUZ60_000401 [Juncus effusus]|nr:hypothetical protein LUZ60_000401 [Juncus effusus]
MKRLKYLGLRDTDVEKLPSSIQNLVLLETLDARGTFLKKVPAGIWKIRTLNHVFIRSSSLSIPASGTTSSLQTLWLHYGGVWHDTKRDLKKRDLLSQFVKEQAHLSYFKLTTHSDASIHTELLNKKSDDLRVLKLRGAIKENQLPDQSLFPQGIQELSLEFTHLKIDSNPIATLEKLRRLVTLKLGFMAFEGKSMHCSNNGFHELLHLQIHASLISEGWTVENGAMNKVEFLNITHCFDMKKIPDALRNLNGLKEVRFQWIRQEIKMRLKNKEGEDWEKIKHVYILKTSYAYFLLHSLLVQTH